MARASDGGEPGEVVSDRALNRATLARQMLLHRHDLGASEAIERLVGMQAQAPLAPYVGLWTRLNGFQPDELTQLMTERLVVRTVLMRSTVHLVTARDCLTLRPLLQPMLTRTLLTSGYRTGIADLDLEELQTAGRALLDERPLSLAKLGALLHERWPARDGTALANAVRNLVPLIQLPPRGLWGHSGQAVYATAERWLGSPLDADPSLDALVLRYLASFGPATVNDVQAWSRLTRLSDVLQRLRPRLLSFRDARGRELFDLPDAPRPDPDTPAPPRFLPEYDNLLLSHADRARVMRDGRNVPLLPGNGGTSGTLLLDGFYKGDWKVVREQQRAVLRISPFEPVSAAERPALEEEGARLLTFVAPAGAGSAVRFLEP